MKKSIFASLQGKSSKINFASYCMLRQSRCFFSDRCCFAQHQASSLLSCYFVCTQRLFLELQKLRVSGFFGLSLSFRLPAQFK